MSVISLLKFATVDGAQRVENSLLALHQQHLIEVQDAAYVSWPYGKELPRTTQLCRLAGPDALAATFWEMLFGLIFTPQDFAAADSEDDARFSGFGINDQFIRQSRAVLQTGTSAIFILTSGVIQDKVVAGLREPNFELISTNLPPEKYAALRAAFDLSRAPGEQYREPPAGRRECPDADVKLQAET